MSDDNFKEFVVTLYGGDSPSSRKVIAQTEIKAFVRETKRGVEIWWPKGINLDHYEADRELYVNRLTIFSPEYTRTEADLNKTHFPIRLHPLDTISIEFRENVPIII